MNRMEMIDVIFETKLRNQAFNKICPPMNKNTSKNNAIFNYSFLAFACLLLIILNG
jgi:hypothetical protein